MKTVTRYKMIYEHGCNGALAYANKPDKYTPVENEPVELVAASDYDSLKKRFNILVKALTQMSTFEAFEALSKVKE